MADPAGLAALALGEAFRVGKDAAANVLKMKKLAKQLDEEYLQELVPIVQGIVSMVDRGMNPNHEDVTGVMQKLEKELLDLQQYVSQCRQSATWNPFKRLSNSKKIIKGRERIQRSHTVVTYLSLKMAMVASTSAAPASSSRFYSPPIPQHQLVIGMGEYLLRLQSLLLDEGGTRWICVSGMGGVGKTLLVQLLCTIPVVRAHFQDRILWVHLGRHPQVIELQRDLCEQLSQRPARLLQHETDGRMVLSKLVSQQRYLLVLDNAWKRSMLEPFDILGDDNGSKVVVTSRKKDILDQLGARASRMGVEPLSLEDSYSLFCHHAFQTREAPPNLEEHARKLVSRCDGVSLVVEVVAKSMAAKREPRQWEYVLGKLARGKLQGQQDVFEMLRLSYDELEPIHQKCFLLFAARSRARYWLDEFEVLTCWRCLQMTDEDDEEEDDDFEMECHEALCSLEKASLVRFEVEEAMTFCALGWGRGHWGISNLLYELATYIVEKDKLPYVFSARKLSSQSWDWQSVEMICLQDCAAQSLPQIPATSMSFLTLDGDSELADSCFDLLPNLKVLSVWSTRIRGLAESLGNLKHLQVLDLYGCEMECLPRSLGDLDKLVLARLRLSSSVDIGNLCEALHRLTKLESLHLKLQGVSQIDLSFLQSTLKLRELHIAGDWPWKLKATSCFHIKNLFHLKRLRLRCKADPSVHILESLRKLEDFEIANVESTIDWDYQPLKNLKKFNIWSSDVYPKISSKCMLDSLSRSALSLEELCLPFKMKFCTVPPLDNFQSLQKLKVSLAVRCLPGSSRAFPLLQVLRLNGCGLLAELPSLDKLPQLRELELSRCAFERLPEAFGRVEAFPALRTMKIEDFKALVELPALDRLQNLENLTLEGLPSLERLPDTFGSSDAFPVLSVLTLEDCPPLPDLSRGTLPELGHLAIRRCRMKHLPQSVTVLTGLATLSLVDCDQLETLLPDETTSASSINLRELILAGSTRLQSLPSRISSLPSLQLLDVRRCSSLTSIPNSGCFFPRLAKLFLRGSGVVAVPNNLENHRCWIDCRDDGLER